MEPDFGTGKYRIFSIHERSMVEILTSLVQMNWKMLACNLQRVSGQKENQGYGTIVNSFIVGLYMNYAEQ